MKQQSQTQKVLLSLIGLLLIGGLVACQPQGQLANDTNTPSVTNTDAQTASEADVEPAAEAVEEAPSNADALEAEATTIILKINLNEATGEDFMTIPNVGNRMVREFFEYRPYISIQQFRREIGKYVDDDQVAEYEQYVYVPIKVDESDEATLQQIPGVDDAIAAELAAGRPYGSNEAFLEALSPHISTDQLAAAQAYLAD